MILAILFFVTLVNCFDNDCNVNTTYCYNDAVFQKIYNPNCICQPNTVLLRSVDGQFVCMSTRFHQIYNTTFTCNQAGKYCCSSGYVFDLINGNCSAGVNGTSYVAPNNNNIAPYVGMYSCVCNATAGDNCNSPDWTLPFCGWVNGIPITFSSHMCYYRTFLYNIQFQIPFGGNFTDVWFPWFPFSNDNIWDIDGYYGTCCADINQGTDYWIFYENGYNLSSLQCVSWSWVNNDIYISEIIYDEMLFRCFIWWAENGNINNFYCQNAIIDLVSSSFRKPNLVQLSTPNTTIINYRDRRVINNVKRSNSLLRPKNSQRYDPATFS